MEKAIHTNATRVHLIIGLVAGASLAPGSLAAQMVSRALGEPFAWQVVHDEDRPTVSGIVLNASGDAFPGVLLSIPELEVHALSDSAGRFEFDAPPPGEWIVSVEMIGHETIEGRIAVPPGASVRMAVIFHRPQAICTNACIGTACTDLAIQVVDAATGGRPEAPVRLRVEYGGEVYESVHEYDPRNRHRIALVGLGRTIETVGWHSIEILAEGYEPYRLEKVWLEIVPKCHGHLLGRSLRVELTPVR